MAKFQHDFTEDLSKVKQILNDATSSVARVFKKGKRRIQRAYDRHQRQKNIALRRELVSVHAELKKLQQGEQSLQKKLALLEALIREQRAAHTNAATDLETIMNGIAGLDEAARLVLTNMLLKEIPNK